MFQALDCDLFLTQTTLVYNAQKMQFPIKDFFSKCDQTCSVLRIWSHLLKKFLMENFIFCAVLSVPGQKCQRNCQQKFFKCL